MSKQRVSMWIRLCLVGAIVAQALLVFSVVLRDSAVAVVMDVELAGVWATVVCLVLSGVASVAVGKPGNEGTRWASLAVLVTAILLGSTILYGRFYLIDEEMVSFRRGDAVLQGTLVTPRTEPPLAAVVLVHGSGYVTRDEHIFFARQFARSQIATLAYDKRGAGKSTGKLYETDYRGYASDVVAAVRQLSAQVTVPDIPIGLVGFSEAEWVIPLAASQSDSVDFIAVVGASGTSPARQVAMEIRMRLEKKGFDAADIAAAMAVNDEFEEYLRTGQGADALQRTLSTSNDAPWFHAAEDLPEAVYPLSDYEWWRSVMDFNASEAWRQVEVPVLLLKGGKDDRSPADVMARQISDALMEAGNQALTIRVFDDADHMLLVWPLGEQVPPPQFADGYPRALIDWSLQQAQKSQ